MSAPGNYPPPYGPPPEPPRKRHTARNVLLSVLAIVVAAVLVGVAVSDSDPGTGAAGELSTDTAAAEPAGGGGTNERGNYPAALGEPAEITDRNGTHIATVTVTGVTADPTHCDDYAGMAPPPDRGHTLLVELHIATTDQVEGTWLFNRLYLSVIGPDGNTETQRAAMIDCGGQAPMHLGPSQAANASIVLDSAYTSGALVYRPIFAGDAGWEWTF